MKYDNSSTSNLNIDDIDFLITTRIHKDAPSFDGTEINMRIRLTEKAKQAIQQELLKAKLQVIRDIKNSEGYGKMPVGMRDLLSDMSQQLNKDLQKELKENSDETCRIEASSKTS